MRSWVWGGLSALFSSISCVLGKTEMFKMYPLQVVKLNWSSGWMEDGSSQHSCWHSSYPLHLCQTVSCAERAAKYIHAPFTSTSMYIPSLSVVWVFYLFLFLFYFSEYLFALQAISAPDSWLTRATLIHFHGRQFSGFVMFFDPFYIKTSELNLC